MGVGAHLETHFLWSLPAFKWHLNLTHHWKHMFCKPSQATQAKPNSSPEHCSQQKLWVTLPSGKFMQVFHPLHQRLSVQKQTTNTHHVSSIVQSYCPERTEIPSYQWKNIFFLFVLIWVLVWGQGVVVWQGVLFVFLTQNEHCVTDSPSFIPKREINRKALSDKSRN